MKLDKKGRFIDRDLRGDRFFWLIVGLLALSITWWILDSGGSEPGTRTGHVLSQDLTEISGIVLSRRNVGVIWAHNDSGGEARIFAMDTEGRSLGVFPLEGATAIDWEDIAIGPGPSPEKDYLYVADTGNNDLSRQNITIYRVPEPPVSTTAPLQESELGGVEVLPMRFPSEPRECETLLVHPKNGDIYLVTRSRNGSAREHASIFHAPGPHREGRLRTLQFLTSFPAPAGIRGGDISSDGRMVVLRSHSRRHRAGALLWERTNLDRPLHDIFRHQPNHITLRSEVQGESISFSADGKFLFTVSEGRMAPIYRFEVPHAAGTAGSL